MAKKLYVGNLPFSVNDQYLGEIFEEHGTLVSARVITDKHSGRSKGFGFVEMENDQQAEQAIAKMNGTEIEGRALTVSEARPMEERPPRGPRNFGGREGGGREGGGGGFRGGRGGRDGGGRDGGGRGRY